MAQDPDARMIADRYRLIELIGSGGFGETWRAYDELLEIDVAIKLFRNSDPQQRDRYLREARSLARWSHQEGIASVRDLLIAGDQVCLVMDYVAGIDLSVIIARNRGLDLEATRLILSPVAQALSTMHKAGLVHRDVSPENIRVQGNGKGVLLDFGSVLSANDAARTTIMVKPGYAPPEQYGDSASQGAWTDVYALAATAYHCLVGEAPVDSLQRTFADDLKRPSELGVSLPKEVEEALMRGLELDYHRRTQTIEELVRGLEGETTRREAAEPTSEPAPPVPKPTPKQEPKPKAKPAPTPEVTTPRTTKKEVPKQESPKKKHEAIKKPSTHRPQTRKSHSGASKYKRFIPIAAALAVVAVIGGIIMAMRGTDVNIMGGKSQYTNSIGYADFYETRITDDMAAELAGDPTLNTLSLNKCVISDGQIETISKNDAIEYLVFTGSQGFTTLKPVADMKGLSVLAVKGMPSVDLEELLPVTFENVDYLKLTELQISNQGDALTRFPNVRTLDLGANVGIKDLSFLKSCSSLTSLTLSGTDLSQGGTEYLGEVPELSTLNVSRCNLKDLSWVSSLAHLSCFSAMQNEISDLSPLSSCTNLSTLRLSQNTIENVAPLSSCTNLSIVCLDDNQLKDLSGIKGCGKINVLKVDNNQLTNLSFCEELINLAFLDASHNEISDISKLASCAKSEGVFLQYNKIKELDALSNGFTSLSVLNVAYNEISSLEPLSSCSSLAHLVINDNQITSLKGLEDKPLLESLLASKNEIEDISAIEGSTAKLVNIDLGYNKISDISALGSVSPDGVQQFSGDISLLLDHNQIKSIDSLPKASYQGLTLFENPVEDFSALLGSEWFSYSLYLPYNASASYAVLKDASSTLEVHVVDVPYDKQVQLQRDVDNDEMGYGPKVQFTTLDEANAGVQDVRDRINSNISGMPGSVNESE